MLTPLRPAFMKLQRMLTDRGTLPLLHDYHTLVNLLCLLLTEYSTSLGFLTVIVFRPGVRPAHLVVTGPVRYLLGVVPQTCFNDPCGCKRFGIV